MKFLILLQLFLVVYYLSSHDKTVWAESSYNAYHFHCGSILYMCGVPVPFENKCQLLMNDPPVATQVIDDSCTELIDIARQPNGNIYTTTCPDGNMVTSYTKYADTRGKTCTLTLDGCFNCNDSKVIDDGGGISSTIQEVIDFATLAVTTTTTTTVVVPNLTTTTTVIEPNSTTNGSIIVNYINNNTIPITTTPTPVVPNNSIIEITINNNYTITNATTIPPYNNNDTSNSNDTLIPISNNKNTNNPTIAPSTVYNNTTISDSTNPSEIENTTTDYLENFKEQQRILPGVRIMNDVPNLIAFTGDIIQYNGQCDLVLMYNHQYKAGKGMDIHIRTKSIPNNVRSSSLISAIAFRFGNDIFEITNEDDTSFINGIRALSTNFPLKLDENVHVFYNGGGYTSVKETNILMKIPSTYMIELDTINSNAIPKTFKIIVFHDSITMEIRTGYFNTTGLLGSPGKTELYNRNGIPILYNNNTSIDNNNMINNWQVNDIDNNYLNRTTLFHNIQEPQYPQQCIINNYSLGNNNNNEKRIQSISDSNNNRNTNLRRR